MTGRDVTALERELDRLILEWERFFSGDRRTPPALEAAELRRRIRRATESRGLRGALSFRVEQLQHRFATYSGLWERLLREREGGRRAGRRAGGVAPVNAPPAAPVDGEGPDLYQRWCRAKQRLGDAPALGREEFERRLEVQRRQLRQRLGAEVEFDVIVRDGKVRLAARRRRPGGGNG